jgi:hypothetical protein
LDIHSVSSLKQQFTDRHVLIPNKTSLLLLFKAACLAEKQQILI